MPRVEIEEEIVEEIVEEEIEEESEEVEEEEENEEEVSEEPEEEPEEESDEIIVSIGDETPEEAPAAPEWVRELRRKNREDQRRIRELEEQLKAREAPKAVEVGKKPTLEDFDYDTDKYEAAVAQWYDRKRQADAQAAQHRAAEEEQARAWKNKLDGYVEAKAGLKVKDFEDAEAAVSETLDVTQQGVILQGAENSALVIYALGKNPKKAKELADIKDPVKFAFAVAKLETQLKVSNRKAPPPPEKTVKGTKPISGAVDTHLDRLRSEAEKTGDYTKVLQYKRQKKK